MAFALVFVFEEHAVVFMLWGFDVEVARFHAGLKFTF